MKVCRRRQHYIGKDVRNMITVKNLVKRYGNVIALDHFSLEVEDGEIFGLLGPNGSGKTTAINCMLSLLKFNKGEIALFGEPMSETAYDLKRRIGVVPQNVAVFQELTVYENIEYFCGLYIREKRRRRSMVEEALQFAGLEEYGKSYPRKLSGGLLRRLNIACGIAHKPELIFFDEPTVAVDPQSRNHILEGIRRLNREGATIIYTSHYMEEIEQLCSRIMIMDKGKAVAVGTREELKGMISAGEKIRIELPSAEPGLLRRLRELDCVRQAEWEEGMLCIQCRSNGFGMIAVLDLLREERIEPGRIYSEPPTLNDVFLAITGKGLRD